MDKIIEFNHIETINGNGTSLWGKSNGIFEINKVHLYGCCFDWMPKGIWELQLFGPNTVWTHYTDKQIEKEVMKKFKSLVSKHIEHQVKNICWSEQGMQPENGWSFDVILKK